MWRARFGSGFGLVVGQDYQVSECVEQMGEMINTHLNVTEIPERKRSFGGCEHIRGSEDIEDILRMWSRFTSFSIHPSGRSSDNGSEISGSIQGRKFLHEVCDYQLFKNSAPLNRRNT
jgi:hypothetical protein